MYCCGNNFPKSASLLLLRELKKAVQSVETVKCALDRSVYGAIRQAIGSQ